MGLLDRVQWLFRQNGVAADPMEGTVEIEVGFAHSSFKGKGTVGPVMLAYSQYLIESAEIQKRHLEHAETVARTQRLAAASVSTSSH